MQVILAGLGGIGRHHLRVLRQLGVQVTAIADPSPAYDPGPSPVVSSLQEALRSYPCDAVVLAVPVPLHASMGRIVLDSGKHLFIEKPIAPTYEDGRDLIERANAKGLVLAVGHSERFNPALQVFQEQIRAGLPGPLYRVESVRIGPYPQRPASANVVIDLAIHDLEILESLLGEPAWLTARTERRIHPTYEDGVESMMGYPHGAHARLLVNWLSPRKERYVHAYGRMGMLACDLQYRTVRFFENRYNRSHPDEYGIGGIEEGETRDFAVPDQEPLLEQHRDFLSRIHSGTTDVQAVRQALLAVRDAHALLSSARTESRIEITP